MYPNLFVPSGFTFSIWGIIYLLLAAWLIYFLMPYKEKLLVYQNTSISGWFLASCIANFSWILAWHYLQIGLSVVIMLCILTTLFVMYYKLYYQNRHWIVKVPISIYLGWISVATIANITTLLISNGVTGGESASLISCIMISVATLLGLFFALFKKDIFYPMVIIWALYGIRHRHDYADIDMITLVGMAVLALSIVYKLLNRDLYLLKR